MAAKTFFVALLASSLPFTLAAPTSEIKARADSCPGLSSDAPQFFTGPQGNFPAINTWVSFDQMFANYQQSMINAGSSPSDVANIKTAAQNAAANIAVDTRAILGVIIEESSGFVGVRTTFDADGVPTGGLMQASGCTGFDGQTNIGLANIEQMINCGTTHLKQNIEDFGNQDTTATIYPALREYNSGSVDRNDLSDAPNCVGNPFYVSDISQRLQGKIF